MAKYNFEMDLSESTSTGIIVKKLKSGMTVLEFGCAFGRMTRYMKEALGCTVYIVEYDSEAYESAIKYAEDGICGDILKYEWTTKFKDIHFDAIIFADVLEHLSEPSKVLRAAGNMLAEDGKVLVSVPNVTHNDIMLKAYMNRIDYTSVGLLDDTHVHFWGLDNFEEFARDSELYIERVEATYKKIGSTEQFKGTELKASQLLLNLLNERRAGEIYQFLITMQKKPTENTEEKYHLEVPYVYSKVYLDRGKGFNEKEIIIVNALLLNNGAYYVNYRLDDTKDLRCIRFDPVELQGCLLKYLIVRQGTKVLSLQYSESFDFGEEVLIRGNDPQVIIPIERNEEPISIESEFVLRGEEFVDFLEDKIFDLGSLVDDYANRLSGHEKSISDLQEQIDVTEKEAQNLRKKLDEKIVFLGSYQANADSKDTYIVKLDKIIEERGAKISALDKIIEERDAKISALDKIIEERDARISVLDQAVEHYRRYPGVRFLRFVKRVLGGIKRRIKALAH